MSDYQAKLSAFLDGELSEAETLEIEAALIDDPALDARSLNVALQDLPMPVEVITSEFVEDLQATDFKEALAYTSGVSLAEFDESSGTNSAGANESYSAEQSPSSRGGVGGNFSNAINIRGYNVQFQNRMGILAPQADRGTYRRAKVCRQGREIRLWGLGLHCQFTVCTTGSIDCDPRTVRPAVRHGDQHIGEQFSRFRLKRPFLEKKTNNSAHIALP